MQSGKTSFSPLKGLDPFWACRVSSRKNKGEGAFSSSFIYPPRSILKGSSLPRLPPEPLG